MRETLELNVFTLCTLLTACLYVQSTGSHITQWTQSLLQAYRWQHGGLGPTERIVDKPNGWCDSENSPIALLALIGEAWKMPDDWGSQATGHTDRHLAVPVAKANKPPSVTRCCVFIVFITLGGASSPHLRRRKILFFALSLSLPLSVSNRILLDTLDYTVKHYSCVTSFTNITRVNGLEWKRRLMLFKSWKPASWMRFGSLWWCNAITAVLHSFYAIIML